MEDRIIQRQDDIIRALSKKLADKDETKKNFRITANNIKNFY